MRDLSDGTLALAAFGSQNLLGHSSWLREEDGVSHFWSDSASNVLIFLLYLLHRRAADSFCGMLLTANNMPIACSIGVQPMCSVQ